jgi:O-glycosyl hydrolase
MRASTTIATAALASTIIAAPSPRSSSVHLSINPDHKYQQIEGFGFSGAFQRAQLLLNVTADVQQELFDLIFSTETGIGFSMVRNGIGSSNSSFNDWMNSHAYGWDEYDSGQLALSQKAVEYGVDRFYGNAWSAPGFMKNNSDDANGGLLCGVPGSYDEGSACGGQDWRQAYADYFVEYVKLYAAGGVHVTDLGFLNEPDLTTSYASMRSNPEQTADFLPILRKTLDDAGMQDIGIACCEETGFDETVETLAALKELGAEQYLSTVTTHEYSSNISAPLDTDRKVWQSEYCDLGDDWNPDWDGVNDGDGYRWASILHNALSVGNVNAYFWYDSWKFNQVDLLTHATGGSSSKTKQRTTTITRN